MRLTKQTGHAIRILIDCAQANGELIKVADIAARLDITKQNVFKIVHLLSRADFVAAVRGPSGGVRLSRPAAEVRIGDVVRAIEVTRVHIEGEPKSSARLGDAMQLNAVFSDALGAFIGVLDQHSLAELAGAQTSANVAAPPRKRGAAEKRATGAAPERPRRSAPRRA